MKPSIISFLLIVLLLIIQNSASAQSSYTPLFEEKDALSLQAGYGILFYNMDLPGTVNDTDLNQYFTSYGLNYENNASSGIAHFRLGYIDPGKTKSEQGGNVETFTNWKDHLDFSLYFSGGYLHMYNVPLNGNTSANSKYNLFAGGGFDLGGLVFTENHSEETTNYENSFYLVEFQIIALAGIKVPDTNLTVSVSFSLHFVLLWESRKKTNDLVRYDSDYGDLKLQPFGIETYLVYDFESVSGLRIGAIGKFINSLTVSFFAGFTF